MNHEGVLPMEHEQSPETYKAIFVGRLEDLGLGNPDGVPSRLVQASAEELEDYADTLIPQLETPGELDSFSCIDGREILADGAGNDAALRLRRVGGSASNFGVALNAGINVANPEQADELSGTERSAHTALCGGANGEIGDNEAIHANDTIMNAVKTFMTLPGVSTYLDASFDAERAEIVRQNAALTAQVEAADGWNGQKYVESVLNASPENVDELWHDPADEKYHGHDEESVVVILGDKTLRHGKFVWNIAASKRVIDGFEKHGGDRVQLTLAEIAKHLSVADRLPSDKTPLIVLSAA